MKKGDPIEVDITAMALEGKGLGHLAGYTAFVPFALAGQQVLARVTRKRKRALEASLETVIKPAAYETEPLCRHFGQPPRQDGGGCGGCRWQQVPYTRQLAIKEQQVRETLQHLGGFKDIRVEAILPSPEAYYYRNKMEWSFGDKTFIAAEEYEQLKAERQPIPTGFFLGFHLPGSYSTIVDIDECHLVSPEALQLYRASKHMASLGGAPYSTYTNDGFWRHIVIREGFHTGQLMVHFVTTEQFQPDWNKMVSALLEPALSGKQIRSILHSTHTGVSQITGSTPPTVLYGEPFIEESLLGLTFRISAHSFFQTNTQAAEILYQTVLDLAGAAEHDVVYDLYSGTGTIALLLARHGAFQVYGLEEVESAVEDARSNQQHNQILNCAFLAGKVEDRLHEVLRKDTASLVVVDPPRAGLHPRTIQLLCQLQPITIIYVSCNPAALARDLQMLVHEGNYAIHTVQPVDMFPQTAHIETVVKLVLRG